MKKAVLCFAVALCFATVAAAPFDVRADAQKSNYDYSLPGSSSVTLQAADIIGEIYGETVSEAERTVLSSCADLSLSYTAQVPAENVSVSFEGNSLTLSARTYSYTAVNGRETVWTPVKATVGEKAAEFTDGETVDFGEVFREDGEYAEVVYGTYAALDAETVNAAANAAYRAGEAAYDEVVSKTEEWERSYAGYLEKKEAYETYLREAAQYREDCVAFEEYKAAYALWREKYDAYADYLVALEGYEAGVEAYEEYLAAMDKYAQDMAAYREYLAAYEEYRQQYEMYYGQYGETMEKINRHLSAMQLLDTPMTEMARTIRLAVMGGTVTSVLENKLTIVRVFGVPLSTVNMAQTATENVRKILYAYFSLQNDADRYLYYTLNYEFIAENIKNLFVSLDALYDNAKVKEAVRAKDREEQYLILLAQLFVTAHALNDGEICDLAGNVLTEESWRVGGVQNTALRSAEEILGGSFYEDRDDAYPVEEGYPAGLVIPEAPERKEEPVAPDPVRIPTAPEETNDPGPAPVQVTEPTEPEEVLPPGEAPQPYEPEENIGTLAQLFREGKLALREELSEDYAFFLTATAKKKLFDVEYVTVWFHYGAEAEGVNVERGTYAGYRGETPVKEPTAQYFYEFVYWKDENGVKADLTNTGAGMQEEEIHVYPEFREILRTYSVVWEVNGAQLQTVLPYGTDAAQYAPASPAKPEEGAYRYRFIGWDRVPGTVTGDAIYTAIFEKSRVLTWIVGDNVFTCTAYDGEDASAYQPSVARADEENSYYVFLGWDRTPGTVSGDAVYTALYQKKYFVTFSDGRGAGVRFDGTGYIVDCSATYDETFDMEQVLTRAAAATGSVTVIGRNGEAVFPYSSVSAMCRDGQFTLSLRVAYGAGGACEIVAGPESGGYTAIVTCNLNGYDAIRTRLCAFDGETKQYVAHVHEDGRVRFSAVSGKRYRLAAEFAITPLPSKYMTLTTDVSGAAAGEIVRVTAGDVPAGIRFERIRVTAEDGEEIAVENNAFVMPRSAVVVEALCSPVVYSISFVSDGRVVASGTYRYGETPSVPQSLIKAEDENYAYVFVGWDKPVEEFITQDNVYTAVFEKIPVEKPPETVSGGDVLFIVVVSVLCVVGAAGIAAAAYFISRKLRKNKKTPK